MATSGFSRYAAALAQAVRQARDAHGDTQEDAAHEAGISVRRYTEIESGRTNPTLKTLYSVALAFETTPAALLASAEEFQRKR